MDGTSTERMNYQDVPLAPQASVMGQRGMALGMDLPMQKPGTLGAVWLPGPLGCQTILCVRIGRIHLRLRASWLTHHILRHVLVTLGLPTR